MAGNSNMDETKKRRAMITYVLIGVLVIILLNTLLAPQLTQNRVESVPYTQLISMADDGNVGEVNYNLSTGDILFTSKPAEEGAEVQVLLHDLLAQRRHAAAPP